MNICIKDFAQKKTKNFIYLLYIYLICDAHLWILFTSVL